MPWSLQRGRQGIAQWCLAPVSPNFRNGGLRQRRLGDRGECLARDVP